MPTALDLIGGLVLWRRIPLAPEESGRQIPTLRLIDESIAAFSTFFFVRLCRDPDNDPFSYYATEISRGAKTRGNNESYVDF
jgi:hypothetical protein